MSKIKTKKLTAKYWMTLSDSAKFRATKCVYPLTSDDFIESMCKEKPNPKSGFWEMVFKRVRVCEDGMLAITGTIYINK